MRQRGLEPALIRGKVNRSSLSAPAYPTSVAPQSRGIDEMVPFSKRKLTASRRLPQLTLVSFRIACLRVGTQLVTQHQYIGRRFNSQTHFVAGDADDRHHNVIAQADALRLSA